MIELCRALNQCQEIVVYYDSLLFLCIVDFLFLNILKNIKTTDK